MTLKFGIPYVNKTNTLISHLVDMRFVKYDMEKAGDFGLAIRNGLGIQEGRGTTGC
jgi:hypothetical protein